MCAGLKFFERMPDPLFMYFCYTINDLFPVSCPQKEKKRKRENPGICEVFARFDASFLVGKFILV